MVPLHQTREAAAFAGSNHVHHVSGLELFGEHAVALLEVARALAQVKFAQKLHAFGARLLQMPGIRLILFFRELDESKLHGIVAVGGRRLALCDHARPRLHERHRDYLSVGGEHLRHSDFLAENSWTHISCLRLAENRGLIFPVFVSLRIADSYFLSSSR